MDEREKIIARDFTLWIENAAGEFEPIHTAPVVPPEIIKGEIEISGTGTMNWVDYWKVAAFLAPST